MLKKMLVRMAVVLAAVSIVFDSKADVLELTHSLVMNLGDITPDDVRVEGHVQGLLVRDGYAFVFHHGGQVIVYDIDKGEYVSSYFLPGNTSHCNNASFGTEKYSSKSKFPMAYVSDCTYDGSCYVYDLYTDHAVEVQRIYLKDTPVPVECGTGWFIDGTAGRLCMHWFGKVWDFPIPSKRRKSVTLSVAGKEPSGLMNTPRVHQGACEYQGYRFFPCGFAGEPTYLTVNDVSSGQSWSFPTDRDVCPYEPEGVCGWNGGVYVTYPGEGRDLFLYRFEVKKKEPGSGTACKYTRIVTTTDVFEDGYPAEDAIDRLARLGYEGIDMGFDYWVFEGSPFRADDYLEWAGRLRARADEVGIPYTHAHAPGEADSDRWLERSIEASAVLGAKYLVVHPVFRIDGKAIEDDSTFVSINARAIEKWLPLAEERGVVLLSENILWGSSKDPHVIADLVKAVDSPWFGWCFDVGHAWCSGYSPDVLKECSVAPLSVHIQDNHANGDEHLIPGDGTIDFDVFISALKEVGYQGDCVLEAHHQSLYAPDSERDAILSRLLEVALDLRDKMLLL